MTCSLIAIAVGLPVQGADAYAGNSGYRFYSFNLLAPFNPWPFLSILIPQFGHLTEGQLDGYNRLGLGVMMLAGISLPFLWWRRQAIQLRALQLAPLAVCCLILTLMAASTKISFASSVLLDLDPAEHFTKFLAPLRATGRLFWVPYYAILIAILASTFRVFRRRTAIVLLVLALTVQLADTSSVRKWVYSQTSLDFHPTPLKSPVWSRLGAQHKNLIVMPAWQCDNTNTQGGADGFRIFGFLAVAQRMRTNSYYAARYPASTQQYLCGESPLELLHKPLPSDSAYVVNAASAALIAAGPSGPQGCHDIDGFILCSAATDLGLHSSSSGYLAQMNASNRFVFREDPNPTRFLLAGWYVEPGSSWAWSNGHGVFAFVINEEQRSRYKQLALHLAVLVGRQAVKYSVLSADSKVDGSVPGTGHPSTPNLKVRIPLRSGAAQVFEIVTRNPPRPIDIGLNLDPRTLGLGLIEAELEP